MDALSIFIEKTTLPLRRIEKCDDGWKLYPAGQSEQPIFISRQQYDGKMPPTFKFFWEKRILTLKKYDDFIVSAHLDGVLLFEVEAKSYPEKLKKEIAAVEQNYQNYLEQCKKEDEQLEKDLVDYLPLISTCSTLEDDISSLRVPLRVYLKLHFFRGTPSSDFQQRLALMFVLSQIAERIYKRHVSETDKKYSLDLDCCFAALRFGPLFHDDIFPNYHFDMKRMEEAVGLESAHETYENYYEAEQLIAERLPKCPENIKRYLNYVVRELLYLFAEDWNELQSNFMRDGWNNSRLCSDEQDYQYCFEKMKLLHYTNIILPEKIPQNKIDDFVKHFNLA